MFEPGVVLVASSGRQGLADRSEGIRRETAHARGARKDQVLVIGRLKRARVGGSHHGPGWLDQVGESDARLGARVRDKSVIDVHAQARLHLKITELDVVLSIERVLIDVRALVELEQLAAGLGQVDRESTRRRSFQFGVLECAVGWIGDPEPKLLVKARLHQLRAGLEIVPAFDDGKVGFHAPVGQSPVLADGRGRVGE